MVGLTYTPPLLPAVRIAATQSVGPVLEITGAQSATTVENSLAETLLTALGPGNVVTGRVTDATPGGNLTLLLPSGTEVTLHHPPELPVALGALLTMRIATGGATPQATLLALDGKPVAMRVGPGGGNTPQPNPQPGTTTTTVTTPGAMPGAGSASAYAASLVAVISLEDEAALEQALDPDVATLPANEDGEAGPPPIADAALAVLIRAAPAKPGATTPPLGTRYLAVLETEDLPSTPVAAAVSEEEGADGFTPQVATLTGRVVPSTDPGTTQVETAIGTLALQVASQIPVGSAVRLNIRAVAPPATSSPTIAETPAHSLLDEIFQILAPTGQTAQPTSSLVLPTGPALLAAVWSFMVNAPVRAAAKDLGASVKKLLEDAGRPDLAERFQGASPDIGTVQQRPDGWLMAVLPFFGMASEQPVRLYARKSDEDGARENQQHDPGDRIVVEVTLRRIGPMQFDGLIRPQRFDLMLRTGATLDPDLASVIETAFYGAIAECNTVGGISFGPIGRFPMLPPTEGAPGFGVSV